MTPDVNVIPIDFPAPGREMVVSNEDGSYTILINAKLSHDEQMKAYQHALNHINNGDFEKSDIQNIEAQAHELEASENVASEKAVPAPADKYEQRIRQLQKNRKRIQRALKKKEEESKKIIELFGFDNYYIALENKWIYGEYW